METRKWIAAAELATHDLDIFFSGPFMGALLRL